MDAIETALEIGPSSPPSAIVRYPRVVSFAHRSTFQIPPIRDLVERYVGDGKGWADPFSGWSTLAEYRNDIRVFDDDGKPLPVDSHMLAADWAETLPENLAGVLFDPPYSKRQISHVYRGVGREATMEDTNALFYTSVKNPLGRRVRPGGFVISLGYTSYGFGPSRGFEVVEGLLVNTGPLSYDIIVTVERKVSDRSYDWALPPEERGETLEEY